VVNKWKTLPGAVAIAVAVTVGATTTVKGLKGRQEKTRKMVKGKRAEKEPKHRSSLETFPRTAEKLRGMTYLIYEATYLAPEVRGDRTT